MLASNVIWRSKKINEMQYCASAHELPSNTRVTSPMFGGISENLSSFDMLNWLLGDLTD